MGDKPLEGKVALITGASAGLGKHFASVIAEAGAQVVIAARRLNKLEETAQPIIDAGGQVHCVTLDVMESDQIPAVFDAAEEAFGTVDILINNSGIVIAGKVPNIPEDDWDSVIGTNLKGAWMMAQEAARRMIAAKRQGSIVNLASILAFRAQKALSTYSISKAAVAQMTRTMASELAPYGIRVNAMAPGYIATDMNSDFLYSPRGQQMMGEVPIGRYGELGELDECLLMLSGDRSKYLTGAVIPIDGGHSLNIRD
ncbi:MAG: glucose 1-dehydrogenase [Alphaproteobacteria bacterium]|jgi:NAD(P)-dependent dehydrogenase (short-subunit alcohol dehydrogenase family)|nr:glucose 1-dehydrogenase [Alphaproteobacteria bacterium]